MRGAAHCACSSLIALPVAYALTRSPEATAALALGVGFASLLPDLDHGAGTAAGLLRVRWLSRLAQTTVGHRGPASHSLLACLGWALWWGFWAAVALAPAGPTPSLSAFRLVFLVVLAGSTLHVLEDWIPLGSKAGVPLLWPLRRERVKLRLRSPHRRRRSPVNPVSSPREGTDALDTRGDYGGGGGARGRRDRAGLGAGGARAGGGRGGRGAGPGGDPAAVLADAPLQRPL